MANRVPVIPVTDTYDSDGYSQGVPTAFRELPPGDTISAAAIPALDQSKITGLASALAAKASLNNPALTGTPTAPTAALATNSAQIATTAFVKTVVDALIGSAPGTLDTLAEIAAALNSDADFADSITALVAAKLSKSANLSDLTDPAAARANLGIDAPVRDIVTIDADESETTVANGAVTENSFVRVWLQSNDATAKSAVAVPSSGEFTIYLDAQASGEIIAAYEIFYQ